MEEIAEQLHTPPAMQDTLNQDEVFQIRQLLEHFHSGVTLVNNWNGDLISLSEDEEAFPAEINRNYFNLFIIEGTRLRSSHFQMSTDLCLGESLGTDAPIARWLRHLSSKEIQAEIMKFPTIVAIRSHISCSHIDPTQKCHYGYLTDIDIQRGFIGFDFKYSDGIDQAKIESLSDNLHLKNKPRASELSVVHWAVKCADLIGILRNNDQNLSYPKA